MKATADNIILIGPMAAGKSTVAMFLSILLQRPKRSYDDLRFDYYEAQGYDAVRAERLLEEQGDLARVAYWKTFDSMAVERMLAVQQGAVVDLGCHCTVYDDAQSFARVEAALASEPNVFLIEPSSDADESIEILRERRPHILRELDYNERYVRDESNRRLAKHVVYTQGKNPKQTADEIVALLGVTPLAHITRNAYCPCQSGQRFKVCCGRIET